ncbi:hypothetical protein DM02DRAFT_182461 [Periconia macrospinosa]|uniref:Uncharacterized protein n=1 Tax=Periconia macrospinosa TaxID=97972 RepID=A0A2V1D9G1_9PLEO|nr:hypothetical protein DM02DRAFT_182461 [Periconia macrospinosa]
MVTINLKRSRVKRWDKLFFYKWFFLGFSQKGKDNNNDKTIQRHDITHSQRERERERDSVKDKQAIQHNHKTRKSSISIVSEDVVMVGVC